MFGITIFALLLHIGIEACELSGLEIEIPHHYLILLTGITVVVPVWAMTFHALGQYAEAKRLADRSEGMAKQLNVLLQEMQNSDTTDETDAVARKTAYLMLQEAAEWHIQNQMTELGLA